MIVNYIVTATERVEIWSLEEVKNYLRISHDYDDLMIGNLIETAIEYAEKFISICLHRKSITCNLKLTKEFIDFKYTPILEITEIAIIKGQQRQVIDEHFNYKNNLSNRLYFHHQHFNKNMEIKYIAGYRDIIPRPIAHGILLHIAQIYENKEMIGDVNTQVKNLYLPYKKIRI